ncbi:glycoside hydrolase family 78 protein [Luteolibacter sp. GHJ8]|uniref:alpha-L-rhamnosidase n=1 Tax=Luteolibacter rhizosphaerae TaxID=2989719 RepID=A0ABT3FYI8_9BACT|nr:glycoside hydrolase family 78 protein [Luteolibacter rhizosphaerae]MCW1912641.1 glycoside hydrolase family 78 protein [Luteolibacter rhizosphaerae]
MNRFLLAAFALITTSRGDIAAVDPKVLSLQNPEAVDELPRLSWRIESEDKNAIQSAYRLLVASSAELLAKDQGDLWDTGKVVSQTTLHLPYAGKAPGSGTQAHWKVMVWDGQDKASPWSEAARWRTGLLEKGDWKAEWIGLDEVAPADLPWRETMPPLDAFAGASWIRAGKTDAEGKSWFRGKFQLPADRPVRQATVFFTADDEFTLAVNGSASLSGKSWRSVGVKAVAAVLQPGENTLSAEVVNGGAATGLLGAITVEFADGGVLNFSTGKDWEASRDGKRFEAADVQGNNGSAPWGALKPEPVVKSYLPATQLRKDFSVTRQPKRAVLYTTALGHVQARLNGEPVDDSYFAPGWTDYRKRLYYRAHDVSSRIKPGANTLGALLGDGWFRGNISILGQNRHGTKTRLKAQLHLYYDDGSSEVIASDSSWKASTGPILEADMFAGESYDARLEQPGWDAPGFKDEGWKPVVSGPEFEPATLEAYPMPPVRKVAELKAVKIVSPDRGPQMFDFGQNFSGWVRLKVKAPAGTVIRLRFGEMLQPNGKLYTENLRSARATDHYICKGGGEEIWEPRFTFHGFRYAEISGLPYPAETSTLTGIVISSDLETSGSFSCSDALINAIYKNTLWGQLSNYLEVPTDCPQRDERMGWSGDTQVFAQTAAYNMDVNAFLTKWTQDMVDAQSPAGAFPGMAPVYHDMWSPGWADAGVIVPWTLYRMYGDTRAAMEHFEAIRKHLALYRSKAPQDIGPNEGFGDWLAVGGDTPKDLLGTGYHAYSNKLASELATALGMTEEAAAYAKRFQEIRRAFQGAFVKADGKIGNDTQTGYLAALRFELLDEQQQAKAAKHLAAAIDAKGGHLGTGFLGVNLLLPVLSEIGRDDLAYALIRKKTYPSWGYSIEQGATTIWERWNSYTVENGFGDVSMNSFNHYAYGACVEWLYQSVLGITPLEPGFGKISIAPVPGGGLRHAKGHYQSVRGTISCSWQTDGKSFEMEVTVPPNTSAEVSVPARPGAKVTQEGARFLREEKNRTIFETGSGTYRFQVTLN